MYGAGDDLPRDNFFGQPPKVELYEKKWKQE